jgi:hypothetical protein
VRGEICVKSDGSTGVLLTSDYLSLGLIFAFIVHFRLTDLCRILYIGTICKNDCYGINGRGLITDRSKDISSIHHSQTGSDGQTTSYSMDNVGFFFPPRDVKPSGT